MFIAFSLVGIGMMVGGAIVYRNATTGPITTVRVSECHTPGTAYGHSEVCSGAFVTGGALVGGNGHVVIGTIEGATSEDIGKTLKVRVHGGRAYIPSIRLPIILFVMGLFIAGTFLYTAWSMWETSAPPKPRETTVAGLPSS
jgi:hypothetical protein